MRHAERAVQPVGDPGIEINLDHDRHRQQEDHQRLANDLFALKAEQQHERREQCDERDRLQNPKQLQQSRLAGARKDRPPPQLRCHYRHDDVEHD